MGNLQDKISLIMNSNKINVEDYAESIKEMIGEESLAEDLNGGMILTNNRVSFCFIQELWLLAKQHKLPVLNGYIGYESLEKAYSYSHTKNVLPHAINGVIVLSIFDKKVKIWKDISVKAKSVQVISAFSNKSIIVISTQIPEYFFLLPHNKNDKIITISTTWSSFIKTLCSLSLMSDRDVMDAMVPLLNKIKDSDDILDPVKSLSEIVSNIID
jgi:hypothetical protein